MRRTQTPVTQSKRPFYCLCVERQPATPRPARTGHGEEAAAFVLVGWLRWVGLGAGGEGGSQGNIKRGEGGKGRSGTQNIVHQKWPNKFVPTANFVFPTMATLVGRGGGGGGGVQGG